MKKTRPTSIDEKTEDMHTSSPDTVRGVVREAYTQALRSSRQGAPSDCCGPAPSPKSPEEAVRTRAATGGCCSGSASVSSQTDAATTPAGVAATSAGYDEATRQVFSEAAQSSFGCGNPLAFADVAPGETVLDLGSGAGFDLLIASQKVGPTGKVIGVDMTDAMVEASRENARRAMVENIEVRKGYIEELPVDDGSVDWVISNCVINLSPQKEAVFAEIARVLRPGGRFSISDIVAEDLPEDLRRQAQAYSACVGGAISEQEYVAGLQRAGMAEVEVSDRVVYDETQLQGIVGSDLEAVGGDPHRLDEQIGQAAGKVWSARFTGRR
jgi:arsenite methyltransferase